MKLTYSWLCEHLDTQADATALADRLTAIGLEVEKLEDAGARLADFTVAHVVSAEKHPNADKLKLCMVDTGADIVQVVCGAPNARTGIKAVFARPGVVIPYSGDVLKVGAIRGLESRGMLCSARELLLSDEHEGIIELPSEAEIGTPAARALGLDDPVIEISLTPNRGDCTGVHGIARDLAAAGMGQLKTKDPQKIGGSFVSPLGVRITETAAQQGACPLFAGRLIRGVRNGPSPQWLQDRLRAVGLRPISALVDITNLMSLDRGRPLHVFDADTLTGGICVRMATDGETLRALDGRTYALDSSMCVIADESGALSLGGIMGGETSGCTEATVNVFVEAALFDPARIAATGRKLGIVSDARYRFERGVDPQFCIPGLELATHWILELCGGEASEIVVAGQIPEWRRQIVLAPDTVSRLTGLSLDVIQIEQILTGLGFGVDARDGELRVSPPSWRGDVHGPADLVEEVVRMHGIDQVPAVPLPRPFAVARPVLTSAQRRARLCRRALAARGFHECVHYSFLARSKAALFGGGDAARQLENPIAADLDALRPTPLPSLLDAAARNQARGQSCLTLFEVGAGFSSGLPGEQETIAAAVRVGTPSPDWRKMQRPPDVFDAKADMLAVLEILMGSAMTAPVRAGAPSWYHPGRSGVLALGPRIIAQFGELHPRICEAFELKGPLVACEIFLDRIPEPKNRGKARAVFAPSALQPVERDFAFVVADDVAAEDVLKAARMAERALIESCSVFDVYAGPGVPEGKKSLAIRVRLQPRDRTLTDAQIDAIAAKIVAAIGKATGGTLRG
ncbi:MAG: phenylalanine--tRNA ligase subunit beta [Alphaproteobacteria bacterium]|nr:phenylalanine--tRNA ligase subunit beta [Alphaproteobacteria bacterium]